MKKKKILTIALIGALMSIATEATAQNCVIYANLKASSVFVDDDYIVYVEKNDNNAVIGIDCQTGEKKTLIPGIAGVYEGARPRIKKAHKAGQRLFFTLENQEGGYIWDGKSVQTSSPMTLATDLYVTTDHHALFRSSRRVDGKLAYDLWDLKQDKHLVSFAYNELGGNGDLYNTTVFIDAKGNLWTDYPKIVENGANTYTYYGIKRLTPEGRWDFYDLGTQSYVAENKVTPGRVFQKGDYIYRAAGRRIYRINTMSPTPAWEEYAKIPASQNSNFEKFAIDSKGNMFTNAKKLLEGVDYNNQYWRAGTFDRPQTLGNEIQTGASQYIYKRLDPGQCSMRVDALDNFVFLDSDGTDLYIYNPNGVVGYTKVKSMIIVK